MPLTTLFADFVQGEKQEIDVNLIKYGKTNSYDGIKDIQIRQIHKNILDFKMFIAKSGLL